MSVLDELGPDLARCIFSYLSVDDMEKVDSKIVNDDDDYLWRMKLKQEGISLKDLYLLSKELPDSVLLERGLYNLYIKRRAWDGTMFSKMARNDEFISNKKHINTKDINGNTMLIFAAANFDKTLDGVKCSEAVSFLIANGADLNAITKNGNTALIFTKDIECCKMLLENGADPNIVANNGAYALLDACIHSSNDSYFDIVQLLIKHGANPNLQEKIGHTALTAAVKLSNPKIVEFLVKNGADINHTSQGFSALRLACGGYADVISCPKTVKILLDNGAKIDNALHMAVAHTNTSRSSDEIVQLLIDHGADLNKRKDDRFNTPLMEVAININTTSKFSTLKLLIDNKANMYALSYGGSLCIGQLCEVGHLEGITYLFDKGFTINNHEIFLIVHSIKCPDINLVNEMFKLFISRGIDVNNQDSEGCNMAMYYFSLKDADKSMMKVFVDAGLDLSLMNKDGKRVFDIAFSL